MKGMMIMIFEFLGGEDGDMALGGSEGDD